MRFEAVRPVGAAHKNDAFGAHVLNADVGGIVTFPGKLRSGLGLGSGSANPKTSPNPDPNPNPNPNPNPIGKLRHGGNLITSGRRYIVPLF